VTIIPTMCPSICSPEIQGHAVLLIFRDEWNSSTRRRGQSGRNLAIIQLITWISSLIFAFRCLTRVEEHFYTCYSGLGCISYCCEHKFNQIGDILIQATLKRLCSRWISCSIVVYDVKVPASICQSNTIYGIKRGGDWLEAIDWQVHAIYGNAYQQ
jgi:hypothetical protein